jgi:hypothetical protein
LFKVRSASDDHVVMSALSAVRNLTATSLALLLLPAVGAAAAVAPPPPHPFVASPWASALPAATPIGPAGYTYGQEMNREIVEGYQHASINTFGYAPVVYTVSADQPTVAVAAWNCQNKPKLDQGLIDQLSAVPLPATALIPADSDAHVAVWQPATDTVWEMWKTRKVNGQWQACWGGKLTQASSSQGTFAFPYGPTATGFSLQAGLITLADLASGHIDHAVAVGVDRTKATVFSWPANRTDGKSLDVNAIPEGQRLRLDPTIDLNTITFTPLGRMVAEAMQRYGAIVRDSTLNAVTVYAEHPTTRVFASDPDPYLAYFGGKQKSNQLDAIPWARLQALPLDYGRY